MKKLSPIFIAFALFLSLFSSPSWALMSKENTEKNYFQFVIPAYHTTRQSGQIVDVYVRYAYKAHLPQQDYPDYRALRSDVLSYLEPSNELPEGVYWEILATEIGKHLMKTFPLDGISVQLNVKDNQDPNRYEPGDHGPIYTLGDIKPLDIH